MCFRVAVFLSVVACFLAAADKRAAPSGRGENQDLILTATLYYDPAQIKAMLGTDLDGHYIIADVKVEPKYGKEIVVDRDDFQVRTDKDGEHTQPLAPNQVAGEGGLVLAHGKSEGAASPGMVLGGPLVLRGPGVGDNDNKPAEIKEPSETEPKKNESPLKKLLTQKALPEKKTEEPVSGLLYFPMEKQKLKDLELDYGGRGNRITLRFK
jgi:hypothetical protein